MPRVVFFSFSSINTPSFPGEVSSMPWHFWHGITETFLAECQPICQALSQRFLFGQRLLEACAVGHLGQVKLMLQAGADVNMTSWCRTSPLMEAAKTGQLPVVAYLLTREDLDLSKRDWLGRTTLHRAVLAGQVEVVRTLMLASIQVVEVDTKDWKGNRLLDHLEEGEIKQMVLSRLVADRLKARREAGFQNQREKHESAGDGEELTVKNLGKEVEKIQQLGKDYEFEDDNDESSEAEEDPSDQMLEENLSELVGGENVELVGGENVELVGGENVELVGGENVERGRKRRLEGKSEEDGGSRTVRFRGS